MACISKETLLTYVSKVLTALTTIVFSAVLYLAIFKQGGSADIFSLITGGGGGEGRDDTSKNVIVFLLDLNGGNCPCPPPPPPSLGKEYLEWELEDRYLLEGVLPKSSDVRGLYL